MTSTPPKSRSAEFDAYAPEYNAGMNNPLKQLLGNDAESYIRVKVDWLLRDLSKMSPSGRSNDRLSLLDYGCGAGTMLSVLRQCGFTGMLAGCDVSNEMLQEAQRKWFSGPIPEIRQIRLGQDCFDDGMFDIIVLSAVLHHVEIPSRNNIYKDVFRMLKPHGRVYIFEHNPFNPLTRWVVKHTPIDINAVLLKPIEVRSGLKTFGALQVKTRYIMFFPPRWTFCRSLEMLLYWLPCGAQYVVTAKKDDRENRSVRIGKKL